MLGLKIVEKVGIFHAHSQAEFDLQHHRRSLKSIKYKPAEPINRP